LVGAFEGDVLEHVGEARFALGVVGGAGVDEGVEAEDGGFVALGEDEGEAVGEDFDGGAFFEEGLVRAVGLGLGAGRAGAEAGEEEERGGEESGGEGEWARLALCFLDMSVAHLRMIPSLVVRSSIVYVFVYFLVIDADGGRWDFGAGGRGDGREFGGAEKVSGIIVAGVWHNRVSEAFSWVGCVLSALWRWR
jgi:hypothetical protein